MPMWSKETDTGVLLLERGLPVLARDGGGRWRLESTVKFRHLLGRRVTITGMRVDFDVLDISTITPVGGGADASARPDSDGTVAPTRVPFGNRLGDKLRNAFKRLI